MKKKLMKKFGCVIEILAEKEKYLGKAFRYQITISRRI